MKRGPAILITILVCAFFAVFFVYPAGMVVKQAFEGPDGFTLEFFRAVFENPIYREGSPPRCWRRASRFRSH